MPTIVTENLGKRYTLGELQHYRTLRDAIGGPRGVLRRLGRRPQAAAPEPEQMWALRHVDFEASPGETIGIVGRNGAGKSTFLKILSRITEPTEGRAMLWGRTGSLLEVGTGFHSELTGRENIFLNGSILGMQRQEIKRRFGEIVEFADIALFLDTPVKHYSSGMRMRLAFAVAAHLNLDILLVDEVLAVGDAAFQRKCLGKMSAVASEGRTVVMVSHNMTAINQLCSRALLIESGRVCDDGEPAAVIARYLESSAERSGEFRWADAASAPGDGTATLEAVRVASEGTVTPTVNIDSEVTIEVDFSVRTAGNRSLVVNVYLLDSGGNTILSSANTRRANLIQDDWFGVDHEPGSYRASCSFPANFLNDMRYYVTVHVLSVDTVRVHASADQVLAFDVFDTGATRDAGGPWHGMVRPRLAWRTRALPEDLDPPLGTGLPGAEQQRSLRA
jgi:lipopolysaccharide transport system ATP-binding protein